MNQFRASCGKRRHCVPVGSSKVPHIAVAVTAFVISAVTIFFVSTGQLFLVSGASREFTSVSWLCMHSMGFREGAWTRQA